MEVRIGQSTFPSSGALLLQCHEGSRLVFAVDAAWELCFFGGVEAVQVTRDTAGWTEDDEVERWQVTASKAGPLRFAVSERGSGRAVGSGVVVVSPLLRIGDAVVPPEALCVKTVLARCMGPLSTWLPTLRQVRASGYNAVHFTPLQVLGASGSAYCVADHSALMGAVQADWTELEAFLQRLRAQEGLLSMTDLVWNHAASNCPWLLQHPECGYSVSLDPQQPVNSPHLRPALELDLALQRLQDAIRAGQVPGLPKDVKSEQDVELIVRHVGTTVWESLRLWEYFVVDEALIDRVAAARLTCARAPGSFDEVLERFKARALVHTRVGERFGWTLDETVAVQLFDDAGEFRKAVLTANLHRYREVDALKQTVLTNLRHRLRYLCLELGDVGPLFEGYFCNVPGTSVYCACNGWTVTVGSADHAAPTSQAYLQREVIVWSDLIKLRYGDSPRDCPFLWDTMERYTRQTAALFDGVRIDNAHTTPSAVADHMLAVARAVKPGLYVVGELFAGSDVAAAQYLSQAGGIHCTVVEAMRAWDPKQLSHLVHRFGGGLEHPVGAVVMEAGTSPSLRPSIPAAMLMDCSHDNRTPAQERHILDTLSNAACVWSANCAVGSTWGLDELVPLNLSVERERRLYAPPVDESRPLPGICAAKARLGQLHQSLAVRGFRELHVHQEGDLLLITRHHPDTHDAFVFVVHTAFDLTAPRLAERQVALPEGCEFSFAFGLVLEVPEDWSATHDWQGAGPFIEGVQCSRLTVLDGDQAAAHFLRGSNGALLELQNFPPGSVIVLQTRLPTAAQNALKGIRAMLADGSALRALAQCTLLDLNVIMYRCDAEERATTSTGAYVFPDVDAPAYCGIAGLCQLLQLKVAGDLGSPVYENVRRGDWLLQYCWERLERHRNVAPGVHLFARWLRTVSELCAQLPRHLLPHHFTSVLLHAQAACVAQCVALMPGLEARPSLRRGLALQLALGSVQMHGYLPGADVRALVGGVSWRNGRATLAAGLPWFSVGFMRCWGRDTCIALRGLFLVTGRFAEACDLMCVFAATVRNGVVPNLLDGASRPRYNARDSTWWFLQALQDMYHFNREGTLALLRKSVPRLYPGHNGTKAAFAHVSDVVQEIMQAHASGVAYRDDGIDHDMRDAGFDVRVQLDLATGLIHGGNASNCGTWMDKMGSSDRAGNRGVPATPRDGCAIEIAAMLFVSCGKLLRGLPPLFLTLWCPCTKSTLRWLAELHAEGVYAKSGVALVSRGQNFLTWRDWATLIEGDFERLYYVPLDENEDDKHALEARFVHRRGIYKDCVGSSAGYTDYQVLSFGWLAGVFLTRVRSCVATSPLPWRWHRRSLTRCSWRRCGGFFA